MRQWVETRKLEVVLALVSMMAIGAGVFWWKTAGEGGTKIEVLSANSEVASGAGELVIDVQGAVVRPGVYRLVSGARVGEAIDGAGGLTTEADSGWVEANLNRAARIVDGMKVYVPKKSETPSSKFETNPNIKSQNTKISINNASQAELESLPGVGPVTAQKMIANRPYGDISDLVGKKIVGQKVFGQIKDLITLW